MRVLEAVRSCKHCKGSTSVYHGKQPDECCRMLTYLYLMSSKRLAWLPLHTDNIYIYIYREREREGEQERERTRAEYIYIYIHMQNIYIYIHTHIIDIYWEREREGERARVLRGFFEAPMTSLFITSLKHPWQVCLLLKIHTTRSLLRYPKPLKVRSLLRYPKPLKVMH